MTQWHAEQTGETGTRYLGSHRGTPAFWAHIFISCESIFNCLAERGDGAPSTFQRCILVVGYSAYKYALGSGVRHSLVYSLIKWTTQRSFENDLEYSKATLSRHQIKVAANRKKDFDSTVQLVEYAIKYCKYNKRNQI